ncbi:hypothetical protein L1049_022573 [Liquidambar formosana]|uniref:Protein kinase domain-containing protein n=1 Tax=Liquidambar formosana TaxID=63359 RepID=A0AAP0RCN1_LIQFO
MGSSFSCCGSERVDEGVTVGGGNTSWRIFTYKELHTATNGFSEDNKLGEGGFGSVYWGKTSDGLQIAVKKLKAMNSKAEMEFAVEVEVLGRVVHKNLLGLRGYCAGADQRLIVYDYMPNLSLLSHLHGQFAGEVQLDWKRRMKIAIGSAEGLLYLHHEVTPHIIHRDIKASNVLLDSDFEPLVADFGFAKLIPDGVSHMTTRVKGTLGYLAPEYAMWGKVSESCDVYSFGILLLEILTGRKPIEKLPGGVKRTITEWAEPLIIKGRFKDLADPKLRGNFDEKQLRHGINIASLCVQSEPEKRPNMKEVVSLLKNEPKAKVMQMRIESVKYGEDLMALDQASDDDDDKTGAFDESNGYGVFGAMEVQKMHDPYGRHGDRRTAKRNTPWRIFTYKELHTATNGFSEDSKLGEGGFGRMYWGKTSDGLQIAVKKLEPMNSKAEMEFAVELEVLGRVVHKNLLGLRGYCAGTDHRLIVYNYIPNLSLLSHLHGKFAGEVQLDWKRRMKIAIGSAEALLYLHHEVTPHIIHRNIKASNVLLDSDFEPLVADFGFAKLIPDGVSHVTTSVKGTLGYLAPEYAMWGKVSKSCDVYSFGILLLEILTGRKPIEKLPGGVKRTITEWAEPLIVNGRFKDLADPKLRGNFDENQLKRAINIVALCAQSEPEKRPNMEEVVSLLKNEPKAKVMQIRVESVKYGEAETDLPGGQVSHGHPQPF